MNFLTKTFTLNKTILPGHTFLVSTIRNHWNKDYKPGPYPKNEEEWERNAKKYNLHKSEYHPYPDDGTGLGDYPDLPMISADSKDPFYPYDNPELRRNFEEPLHAEFDVMRLDRVDVNAKFRYPLWVMLAQFLGVMFFSCTIITLGEYVKMFHPLVPRQYPKEGKTYYTFEPIC
ncbi:unnamed protein product [Brassicogethes aeneus]|uniref:NADH dehydrogenase [ubiquinone] 1 beta subcomplex subunit 8, mitochondrial n=1 Tax=Brassicogethes aeneus TaxID=1431903 RepID=A0A9P0ARN7_BRAAE|nr:unnamed protein product [Brassicogethes aeneus]